MLSSGMVVHYIRDYSISSIEKTKSTITKFSSQGILNPKIPQGEGLDNFCENLPVGTIVCIDMSKEKSKNAFVCLPILCTNISLPVKPGEIVWFYKDVNSSFDDSDKRSYPMLSISSYWLSRKVGSRNSEDLSFSFLPRDLQVKNLNQENKEKLKSIENTKTLDKKRLKRIKAEEEKTIRLPDYSMPDAYIEKYPFLQDTEINSLYNTSKKSFDFYPAAVPRWNSKPYELSLQGSNNSLINLTKTFAQDVRYQSSGAIDLVAGRHMLEEYREYSQDEFYNVDNKIVKNESDIGKRKISQMSINTSSSYLKIKNIKEDNEILKSQAYYFGEKFKKKNLNLEGEKSFKNDASRIYIAEFDNLDDNSYYDSISHSSIKYVDLKSDESEILFKEKDYLVDSKKVFSKNFLSKKIEKQIKFLPSILFKSNDIRIVARKKVNNSEKTLDAGSIKLIKESNNFYNSSSLLLENDGSVFIDGSTIHIGNFKKEVERLNIDVEKEEDIKKMSGNGYGLLIGYEPKFSEPLVLGSTLESMLKEIMHVNIKLLEEMKKLTDDLAKHTHLGIPITGISGPPQLPAVYSNFSSVEHDDIKKRYEDIQANLKDMLSKFAKTS